MDSSVMRRYVQLEPNAAAQADFALTVWMFLTVITVVLAGVASGILVLWVPESSAFEPKQGALAIMGAALFVGATVVPLTILRAGYELKKYLTLTCVLAGLTTVLTLLLVIVFRMGVTGWLLATIVADVATFATAMFIVPWRRPSHFDTPGLRGALRLGLPLVPHATSGWSLQLADRVILASLVTVSSLGVYTLAANLALPVLVILQGLNLGFLPTYARAHLDRTSLAPLRGAVSLQIAITVILGCIVSLLGPPLVSVFSSDYAGAATLIPWIVLGYVFLGLYFIPMNVISMVVGRTEFVWTLTVTAAAINIAAVYLLVPPYGTLGAAIASAVGYLALLLLVSLYSRLFESRADIDWPAVLPVLVGGSGIVALSCILPAHGTAAVALRSLLLIPLPGLLLHAGGISFSEAAGQLKTFSLSVRTRS
jgi:O-antigen/teichoic acid export membrane protein